MTETEWRTNFSNNLKSAIAKYGCTRAEFAEEVGISVTALDNYIHCKRSPSAYILAKIARVLRCSMDDLADPDL